MYISINKGGLSNRLKSWVSVIKLSEEHKTNFGIYWPVLDSYQKDTHLLNCNFNNLFDNSNNINIENRPINLDTTYISHCLYISDTDEIPNNFNTFDSKCAKKFSKTNKNNRDIDFMYNQIPDGIKSQYINYFKRIKLNNTLEDKVNKFKTNFNENTVSVHIRSWNRNGEMGRRSFLFQIDKFEKEMKNKINNNNNTNFFVSSDSLQVINHFKKLNLNKYSPLYQRLLFYPRETTLDNSRDFPEGIQEDLVELYLLSKNNAIIGSHFSTYSEVAWWLAGCPRDITIL